MMNHSMFWVVYFCAWFVQLNSAIKSTEDESTNFNDVSFKKFYDDNMNENKELYDELMKELSTKLMEKIYHKLKRDISVDGFNDFETKQKSRRQAKPRPPGLWQGDNKNKKDSNIQGNSFEESVDETVKKDTSFRANGNENPPGGLWGREVENNSPPGLWGRDVENNSPPGLWGRDAEVYYNDMNKKSDSDDFFEKLRHDAINSPPGLWGRDVNRNSIVAASEHDTENRSPPGLWGRDAEIASRTGLKVKDYEYLAEESSIENTDEKSKQISDKTSSNNDITYKYKQI